MRVKQPITVCDRCDPRRNERAGSKRRFSVADTEYELDLCETHGALFDREQSGWTRLAREVGPARHAKSAYFTEKTRAETERIRALKAKAEAQAASQDFAQRRAAVIEAETEAASQDAGVVSEVERMQAEAEIRDLIPGSWQWRLTEHAKERMAERKVGLAAVLMAACDPEVSNTSDYNNIPVHVHKRGDCRIVVDRTRKSILTVARRSVDDTQPEHQLQERTAL